MRLLIDMSMSVRWAQLRRTAGFEASHWSHGGPNDADDADIMSYARAGNFVVVTQDLDFGTMLSATTFEKPSVVQISAGNLTAEALGVRIVSALYRMTAELEEGALLTIDDRRTRVRLLPFRLKDR